MDSDVKEGQERPQSALDWNNLCINELKSQIPHPPKKNIFNIFKSKQNNIKGKLLPCAIEVSPTCIKFAQLIRNRDELRIAKIGYIPLTEGQNSPQYIKVTLQNTLRENQIKGKIVCALPLSAMRVFSCVLPGMPENEIEQAITWKLKQGLPADMQFENIAFDYVRFGGSPEDPSKQITALVFYLLRQQAQQQMQFYKSISLEVSAIEPHPYCVFLLMQWFGLIPPEENSMIIFIGRDESSVVMTQAGRPCLVRPLSVSGNGFTSAISAFCRMEKARAEELWLNEGLSASDSGSQCMKALSGQLESLVVEIEHATRFMPGEAARTAVFEKIIMSGEAASMRGLDKFLSKKLSASAALVDPLTSSKLRLPEAIGEHVMENSFDFGAVLGAAVELS